MECALRNRCMPSSTPSSVMDGHLQSEQIAPGEQVVGVVALEMAPGPGPTVLRLQFSGSKDGSDESNKQQIAAFLVR